MKPSKAKKGGYRMKLTAGEVSRLVGVHIETVRALAKRGVIQATRDLNGWRRFSPYVVDKLKRLFSSPEEIFSIKTRTNHAEKRGRGRKKKGERGQAVPPTRRWEENRK